MIKSTCAVLGICLCLWSGCQHVPSVYSKTPPKEAPPVAFRFINVPVPQVLDFYGNLTHTKLVISTAVHSALPMITLRTVKPETTESAARMIEEALREQAGVIVTRIGPERTSVTYNDRLPVPF